MIDALEKRISYTFKNRDLVETAIIHKSHNEGRLVPKVDNERLELLGDSVIGLVITDFLYQKYHNMAEGDLSKIKAHLVSTNFLYKVARNLNLGEYILLGKGEEKNQGRENKRIVASFFEALIGAVFLDSDFHITKLMVIDFFQPQIIDLLKETIKINDYKSELQEFIQKKDKQLPVYVIKRSGDDQDSGFTATVFINDLEVGEGVGRSKKEAEHKAAYQALLKQDNKKTYIKLSEVFLLKNDKIT
jgi:ribonuclease-3